MRRALLSLVLTIAATAVGVSPATAAAPPIPENDPFFAAPRNVAAAKPGQILASRPVQVKAFELPVPASAWQVKYRTADRTGKPTVTVTTLIVPKQAWKGAGSRPVVSYQTAEDGVSTRCAPSYALTAGSQGGFTGSYSESPIVVTALLKGWAISVPDYEGIESQFLVADTAAKAILDGLRAVKSFKPAGLGRSPLGIWGYSGGAFATANAAQLQRSYAPDLKLTAIALGGLLGDVRSTINAFDGSVGGGAVPMGFHGFDRAYPKMNLRGELNAQGQKYFDATANDCLFDAALRYPFLKVSQIEASPKTLDKPKVAAMLRENSPVARPGIPTAPVYEYHTTFDEFAPIKPARATLRNYCAGGIPVEYREKLIGEHLTEIVLGVPGAINFLDGRFKGKAPINLCSRIPK